MIWRDALGAVGTMSAAGDLKICLADDLGVVITTNVAVTRGWVHQVASRVASRHIVHQYEVWRKDEDHDGGCVEGCSPREMVVVHGGGVA